MKTLTLSLKKKWFDLIKAGVKKEGVKPRPFVGVSVRNYTNAQNSGPSIAGYVIRTARAAMQR